jgi:hypothetical protein
MVAMVVNIDFEAYNSDAASIILREDGAGIAGDRGCLRSDVVTAVEDISA